MQYVTRTMEVESPATQRQLAEARERNELLSERLSAQSETCRQLEKRLRLSDEETAGLQQKVIRASYQHSRCGCRSARRV